MASGIAGAFLGNLLRVPAGVFVGTMAGVGGGLAVLNFPPITSPPIVNQMLQVAIGLFVGLRITRGSLVSGVRSLLPAALLATLCS